MMGQRNRGEREREGEVGRGVECWMGDGVASRRCWERPTRQTEGGTAMLSIRVGMCLCVPVRDRSVGTHPWMMKGNHVFGKQT